jgi:hypothetical protein
VPEIGNVLPGSASLAGEAPNHELPVGRLSVRRTPFELGDAPLTRELIACIPFAGDPRHGRRYGLNGGPGRCARESGEAPNHELPVGRLSVRRTPFELGDAPLTREGIATGEGWVRLSHAGGRRGEAGRKGAADGNRCDTHWHGWSFVYLTPFDKVVHASRRAALTYINMAQPLG